MAAINDQKKIIDMALSTAIMGSFAIPGVGAVGAAVISTGQLFFDIFCPGAPVDTRNETTTNADLSKAMDDLKQAMADDLWWSRIDDVQADVLAANKLFMTIWKNMGKVGVDVLNVDDGTGTKQTFVVGRGDADFADDAKSYFDLGNLQGTGPNLDAAADKLTLTTVSDSALNLDPVKVQKHQTRTTSLYCLIASLTISYWKAAVLWRWGHDQVLLYQEWLAYLALNSAWKGRSSAYQKLHLKEEPISPVKAGDPAPGQPDWNVWAASADAPVQQFLDAVDEILEYSLGNGSDESPGLYSKMSDHWNAARAPKVGDRIAMLSMQSQTTGLGTYYYYADSNLNGVGFPVTKPALAELQMEAKAGALIAYEWDYWTQAYGLDGVDEDDLKNYGGMIRLWKQARQSVDFSIYTTSQGDTLPSIAALTVIDPNTTPVTRGYGNPDLAPIIFSANRAQLGTLDDVFPAGKVLHIPNLKTYTVAAGDALISIAAKPDIYGEGGKYPVIYNANRDILKDPNVIGNGQVLRIPDLAYTPDSSYTVLTGDTLVGIARAFYGHGDFYLKIFEANKDVLKTPNSVAPGQKLTIPGLDPVLGSVEWCDAADSNAKWDMWRGPNQLRYSSLRDAAVEMFGNPDLSLKIFDLNSSLWKDFTDPNAFPDLQNAHAKMAVPQLSYRALSGESLDEIAAQFYGASLPTDCTKVMAKMNGLTPSSLTTSGQVLTIVSRPAVLLQRFNI